MGVFIVILEMWMGVLIVNGDVDGCLDCHMEMWMGVLIVIW